MAAQDGSRSGDTSTQVVALGGALAVIGLAAAQHLAGYDPPAGLEGALTVALSTLLSWYLPARRARTIPVRDSIYRHALFFVDFSRGLGPGSPGPNTLRTWAYRAMC